MQGLNQGRAICRQGNHVETTSLDGPTKHCLPSCRAEEQLLQEDRWGLKAATASHQGPDAGEVMLRHSIKWSLLWGSSTELSRDSSAEEGAEPGATPWAGTRGDFGDVQEGLSRGFGLEGHLQTLLPRPCSMQAASSHCPTSSPAAPQHLEVTGCCFYLHRTPAAGGQWDETCLTHAYARIAASPPSRPGNLLLPPAPCS